MTRVLASLSSRIAALSMSITLAASLLIGGGAYVVVRKEINDLVELRLAAAERTAAAEVANVLSTLSVNLSGLAANRVAANALVDNMGRNVYVTPFLRGVTRMTGLQGDIVLMDYKGRPLAWAGEASFGVADFPWLTSVVDTGTAMARLERRRGGLHIVLAEPIIYANTGTPEGILAFAMPVEQLHRFDSTLGIRHSLAFTGSAEPVDRKVTDRLYARSISASPPLDGLGVVLYSEVAPALISGPLQSVASLIITVVGAVIVVMVPAGLWLARAVTTPLRSLAREATGISTEDRQPHFLRRPHDPVEVAQLADAMHGMLERLSSAYVALERESRALVRNAERVANIGTWRWHPVEDRMRWSDNVAEILGVDAGSPPSLEALCGSVCPPPGCRLREEMLAGLPRIELDGTIPGATPRHIRLLVGRRETVSGIVYDGTVMDVTQLRQTETALRQKQAALTAILDNFPFLTWLKDLDGHYLAVNRIFAQACGRDDPAQVIGLTDGEVWPAELAGRYRADDIEVQTTRQRKTVEEPMFGSPTTWVETFRTPVIDRDGRLWGTAGFARDITARMSIQEELRKTSDELKRSNAELQQFAYVVSHDLRAPLRTVSSFVQLLRRHLGESLDEEGRELIDFAVSGAKRMDALIVGLLEYARVGRQDAPMEAVPLDEVLAVAADDLLASARASGAVITVAENLPSVIGHRIELLRLFENLIGNAIKYHAPDRLPVIDIGWRDDGDAWVVWVRDNGIGIAPADRERVFGVFERLVGAEQIEGTGIGLAVCKKVVEHHGGRIWIESRAGEGSTFLVAFPKRATPRPHAQPARLTSA